MLLASGGPWTGEIVDSGVHLDFRLAASRGITFQEFERLRDALVVSFPITNPQTRNIIQRRPSLSEYRI